MLYIDPSPWQDDELFGKSLASYGHAAAAAFLTPEDGMYSAWPYDIPTPSLNVSGLKEWIVKDRPREFSFATADLPVAEVARGLVAVGDTNGTQDRDGVYRRERLFSLFDGRTVPALAFVAEKRHVAEVHHESGVGTE